MTNHNTPRSLRFDADTEARLILFSQLTGTSTADVIRNFVNEGLARYSTQEALQPIVDKHTATLQEGLATLTGQVVRVEVHMDVPTLSQEG